MARPALFAGAGGFGPWLASQKPIWHAAVWALLGVVTALGQAPLGIFMATLLGLVLAYWAIIETARPFRSGLFFGAGYFALTLSWIIEPFLVDVVRHGWMAPFALLGVAFGFGLFWGAAFWLARRIPGPLWLTWAVCLTLAELLRAYLFTGFPWGMVAYAWVDTPLRHWAAWIGPHGLNLLTFLSVSLGLHVFLTHRRAWVIGACFGGMVFVALLARPDMQIPDPSRPLIRLVQPNAPQHLKWDPDWVSVFFERQLGFTGAVAEATPDLVIWPETSVPALLHNADAGFRRMAQASGGAPVVAGIQRLDGLRIYNSLIVTDPQGGVASVYDKHHLVPFGEYLPGSSVLARFGFKGIAADDGAGYSAGPGPELLQIAGMPTALPLICYEAVFPQDVGGTATRPGWLLQITNDAWFGEISGPYQHLAQARFRAVEQGLPMVRVANTGVSAVIDPGGYVVDALPLGVAGFLDVRLPHPSAPTLYSRTGDWLAGLLALALLICGTIARRGKGN